jgi:KipI family sensor histidine kinase inhibitor
MRRRPFGPEAWIVDRLDDPTAWAELVRHGSIAGIVDVVPAETTVVVRCGRDHCVEVGERLDSITDDGRPTPPARPVEIDVVYDGPDLAWVADTIGSSIADVIDLHRTGRYIAAFCGFSPGFAYLTGLDERLVLPRRDRPRTTVPAGSVAIAAGYSAVYPSASPGGWHLLGRTDARMWDLDRQPPALLVPGTPVRFRRVDP